MIVINPLTCQAEEVSELYWAINFLLNRAAKVPGWTKDTYTAQGHPDATAYNYESMLNKAIKLIENTK